MRYFSSPTKTTSTSVTSLRLLVPVIVGVFAFELLLFVNQITFALIGHAWLLFHCLVILLYSEEPPLSLRWIALLPVFRLATLGQPELLEGPLNWLVVSYALVLITMLVLIRFSKYRLELLTRVKSKALIQLIALLISVFMLANVLFSVEPPAQSTLASVSGQSVLLFVVLVLFVPLVEELLFRGLIQKQLTTEHGVIFGVLVSGLLSGVMHSPEGTLSSLLVYLCLGVTFAASYHIGDGLLPAFVLHAAANLIYYFGEFVSLIIIS